MPRKKQSFLKKDKKEELFSNYSFQEEEDNNKENQSQSFLNNSITISIDSEKNIQKSDDDSDYNNEGEELENDESFDFNKVEKSAQLMRNNKNKKFFTIKKKNNEHSFIKKKRARSSIKKNNKKKKVYPKIGDEDNKKGKSAKKKNFNTFSELDKCYKKLDDLISEYSFSDIADIIIKINNDINNDKSELFKRMKKITSTIRNKESISMMCLSILYSKLSSNNTYKEISKKNGEKKDISENEKEDEKEDEKEEKEGEEDEEEEKEEEITELKKNKYVSDEDSEDPEEYNTKRKYGRIVKGFNGMKQIKYIFGNHYYKDKNNIYCYYSRTLKPRRYVSAYCYHRELGCNAKCVIFGNCNRVQLYGTHISNCPVSKRIFYLDYPDLKNKKWTHVQIIKKKYKYNTLIVQS